MDTTTSNTFYGDYTVSDAVMSHGKSAGRTTSKVAQVRNNITGTTHFVCRECGYSGATYPVVFGHLQTHRPRKDSPTSTGQAISMLTKEYEKRIARLSRAIEAERKKRKEAEASIQALTRAITSIRK